ncbi:hypothetical protein D3C76_471190 [compost metagenome]
MKMIIKYFCLPLAVSMQLISSDAFSAVYCGVVNGVQVWDELVPSDCAKALRQMQLSNEHIQSAQRGQRIESHYGAPSSKAVENVITSVGDYLQRNADERADAEQAALAQQYAEEDEKKRILIAQLSNHILADYPEARIRNADCKSSKPGLGVLEAPAFESEQLKKAFAPLYAITLPQMYAEIKSKGRDRFLQEMNAHLTELQGYAYDTFKKAVSINSEVSVKYIQEGQYFPINCSAGSNNANTCKYIGSRYMADYFTTVIGLTEKCVK